jgi:hypothetical protein
VRLALLAGLVLTAVRAMLLFVARPRQAAPGAVPAYAYATFFGSDDFLPGVSVLLHSLAATRPSYPLLICLVEGAVAPETLERALRDAPMEVQVHLWPPLEPPAGSAEPRRWALNWNKLRLWQLTGFSRVLYLDADVMVLRSLDAALAEPLDGGFRGTPDWGKWTRPGSHKMNGGVFLLAPSEDTFERLVALSRQPSRYRSQEAEQGVLNAFFGRRRCTLPHTYNVQKTLAVFHPRFFDLASTRVLHFVGEKPWVIGPASDRTELQLAPQNAPQRAERLRLEAADLRDSADFSELHGLWWACYLRARRREFAAHLTLLGVGAGEGGAAVAHWPVAVQPLGGAAPALIQAAARLPQLRTPYIGFVRVGGLPPPWPSVQMDAGSPSIVAWGSDWVGDLHAAAVARHPDLRLALRHLSTRHLGRRRFMHTERIIMDRSTLRSAAVHVASARRHLSVKLMDNNAEEALCELLLNIWAAASLNGTSAVAWL